MKPICLNANDKILAVVGHPDDEILGCYGLLAKAVRAGAKVWICIVNHGKQARLPVSREQAALLGVEVFTSSVFDAKNQTCDRELIQEIDGWIKDFEPTLIVTHGEFACDHQEHRAVGQATAICWDRFVQSTGGQCRLLRMCPIPTGLGFAVNAICDIGEVLNLKTRALDAMMQFDARWYLSSGLAECFASDLASRYANGSGAAFLEVFDEELERGVFNAPNLKSKYSL